MATFENGENYLIRVEMKKKHFSHNTTDNLYDLESTMLITSFYLGTKHFLLLIWQ